MTKSNKSSATLRDTGERMIPKFSIGRTVYGEHIVRYESVLSIVKNKTVLDVASGSGYGTKLLASQAKHVIGVDVSEEAVEYSKANYSAKNVTFKRGDGANIPIEDNSVDVVVSFETIEHIDDYVTFMKEIKRVLKKGGTFILSTPNDIEYSVENHFHIHEFQKKELQELVKKYYSNLQTYLQVDWVYSSIMDEAMVGKEWRGDIETLNRAPVGFEQALYFLIIASDTELDFKLSPLAVISEHWSERRNRETEMVFKKHMDDQAEIIRHFQNEAKHAQERATVFEKQLKSTIKELEDIKCSASRKVANKIKVAKSKLTRST